MSTTILDILFENMRNSVLTDYSIGFDYTEAKDESGELNNEINSINKLSHLEAILIDVEAQFPGAKFKKSDSNEVIGVEYKVHRLIVAAFSKLLHGSMMRSDQPGVCLNWSDYETLIAGCVVVKYFYSRKVEFSNIRTISIRIAEKRGVLDVHGVFCGILDKIKYISDTLQVECLKQPMKELRELQISLEQTRLPKDQEKIYAYRIIGNSLVGKLHGIKC